MKSKGIILVEPKLTGHHISLYVNLIASECLNRNIDCVVLTWQDESSKPLDEFIKSYPTIKVYYINKISYIPNISILKNRFIMFFQILLSLHIVRKDYFNYTVLFTGLECCFRYFSILSFIKKFNISGILLLPNHLYSRSFKAIIDSYLLNKLVNLNSNGSFFTVDVRSLNIVSSNSNLLVIPEAKKHFVYTPKLRHNSRKRILVYGSITFRKNYHLLIDLVTKYKLTDIDIIIAGQQDEASKKFLKSDIVQPLLSSNQLAIYPFYHSDQDEFQLFDSIDIVWIAYDKTFDGSSGVLQLAMSFNKHVIVNKSGLIYELAKDYHSITTIDPYISHELANLIDSIQLHDKINFNKKVNEILFETSIVDHFFS